MQRTRFALSILVGLFALSTFAQKKYSTSEAKEHFGETVTVCGEVVSTRYAASTKGQPTFPESRQAISKSDFHGRDLGQQSE